MSENDELQRWKNEATRLSGRCSELASQVGKAEAEVQRLRKSEHDLTVQYLTLTDAMGYVAGDSLLSTEEFAARLRRDAERYQWIRKESCIGIAGKSVIRSPLKRGTPFLEFPNTVVAADFRGPEALPYRYNFDSAIDKRIGEEKAMAALAQAEKGGGNG